MENLSLSGKYFNKQTMLNVNCNPFLIGIKNGQHLWKQEWNYFVKWTFEFIQS